MLDANEGLGAALIMALSLRPVYIQKAVVLSSNIDAWIEKCTSQYHQTVLKNRDRR